MLQNLERNPPGFLKDEGENKDGKQEKGKEWTLKDNWAGTRYSTRTVEVRDLEKGRVAFQKKKGTSGVVREDTIPKRKKNEKKRKSESKRENGELGTALSGGERKPLLE